MQEKKQWDFGDVKFMGALGLYFGFSSIAEISLLAFFIATIISIGILFVRLVIIKSNDEYIPFGPFLVVAAFCMIFIPANTIFIAFISMCSWISSKILMLFN